MNLIQLIKPCTSNYEVRINNLFDFRHYCDKYRDEIDGYELIINNKAARDFDYKAAIREIVNRNPDSFRLVGNEITLKTSNMDRIINLEVKEFRAESDDIIIVVYYKHNGADIVWPLA